MYRLVRNVSPPVVRNLLSASASVNKLLSTTSISAAVWKKALALTQDPALEIFVMDDDGIALAQRRFGVAHPEGLSTQARP